MKPRLTMLVALLAVISGAAFAHGNKVHVMGTLEKINGDSVLVRTKDGTSVEVKLVASTVYLSRANHQDKSAKLSDLAAGYLVVVHATQKDNTLEADEIKFSVPTVPKVGTPAAAKPQP